MVRPMCLSTASSALWRPICSVHLMDAKSRASSRSMNSLRISKKKWMPGAVAAMSRSTSLAFLRS